MKKTFPLAAPFVLAATCLVSIALASDAKASDDQASWQQDLMAWRAKRATGLQAPEGWLSLIALGWLKEGDNTFGSAADCRVQIGKGPAHIAIVRLEKGALRLLPPSEGFPKDLLVDGQPAKEQALVADDADPTSKLTIGTLTIIVIHRDDQFALRIKDLDALDSHRFPRVALVRAQRRLQSACPLDSLQSSKDPRHPNRSRHDDPHARARRRRIHSRWPSCAPGARARRSEIDRSFLYHARRHQQNYYVRCRTLSLYRTSRPWCRSARRGLARFQSPDKSAVCVHAVCDVSVAPAAESAGRRDTGRRAALPRLINGSIDRK